MEEEQAEENSESGCSIAEAEAQRHCWIRDLDCEGRRRARSSGGEKILRGISRESEGSEKVGSSKGAFGLILKVKIPI